MKPIKTIIPIAIAASLTTLLTLSITSHALADDISGAGSTLIPLKKENDRPINIIILDHDSKWRSKKFIYEKPEPKVKKQSQTTTSVGPATNVELKQSGMTVDDDTDRNTAKVIIVDRNSISCSKDNVCVIRP